MKKYFYHDGKQQLGPFDLAELKREPINRNTLVWYEGIKWTRADEIDELMGLLIVPVPPPHPAETAAKKKKYIKRIVFIIAILAVMVALYAAIEFINKDGSKKKRFDLGSDSTSQDSPTVVKTPQELRKVMRSREQQNPAIYLKLKGTVRENLFGKTILEGTITNHATLANYKDIVLIITWLTKTQTVIKTENHTLYEKVGAGKTISYKIKLNGPDGTADARVVLVGGTVAK